MDDVRYKGYIISTRTVRLEVGGYMATATITDDSGEDSQLTPFDTAVVKTEEEAGRLALDEAKKIIDAK
jgi:hypothetical protein